MRLVLIGETDSKRTVYFQKAADARGLSFQLLPWHTLCNDFDFGQLKDCLVKIDPPSYQTIQLTQMKEQLIHYQHMLHKLRLADCHFFNSPDTIRQLLDKRETKIILQKKNISVTTMFSEFISNFDQLLELMQEKSCFCVFIKPRFFSGAAGVAAFRFHPTRKKMVLYTSCHPDFRNKSETLVNTKKLYRIEKESEIRQILNLLLSLDCIIERWHPKAEYQNKSYDLRVVYQFGHIAYTVVRGSNGPITNLHLNNQALDFSSLELSASVQSSINELCHQAVALFPELSVVGIDILLERGSMKPRIIEMNGQGDLIYQDIYQNNQIYLEQIDTLIH